MAAATPPPQPPAAGGAAAEARADGRVGASEVRHFWASLGAHELGWLRPHVDSLTSQALAQTRNRISTVDQSNPIWLEAPLKRLRMQMKPLGATAGPTVAGTRPSKKEQLDEERRTYEQIARTLVTWDAGRVRDPEQFVVTLQQVLHHSAQVQPSDTVGGVSLLLHTLARLQIHNPDGLLSCWALVLYEFEELSDQLRPLLELHAQMQDSPHFRRILKIALIFLQELFPRGAVEGFNLYLLGEIQGPFLRDFMAKVAQYDPSGELSQYVALTLRPLAEKALGLVEAGADVEILEELRRRVWLCEQLAASPRTTAPVAAALRGFIQATKDRLEQLRKLDFASLAEFLGFAQESRSLAPRPGAGGIPPPPPMPGHVPGQAPLPPPAGPIPPPPPVPPPSAGQLATLGHLARSSHQPRLFPQKAFVPRRFFRAFCAFCNNMEFYRRNHKRPEYRGYFQPFRVLNYVVDTAPQRSVWSDIKESHLTQLEGDLRDVLQRIRGAAELPTDESRMMALVYMVKDMDTTPFCGEPEEDSVARLRWLIDSAYLLYRHTYRQSAEGDRPRLVQMLCSSFTRAGIDPERRLRVWETILTFHRKREQREAVTAQAQQRLRACMSDRRVLQMLACVVMHARAVDGLEKPAAAAGASSDAESALESCEGVLRRFPLLRLMIDNLFKNYEGVVILESLKQHLPVLVDTRNRLRACVDGLSKEVETLRDELQTASCKRLRRAQHSHRVHLQHAVQRGKESDAEPVRFAVGGRDFALPAAAVPAGSLLGGLIDTDLGVARDPEGRIAVEAVDPEAFSHVARWLTCGALPSGLSSGDWNALKVACDFLGVDSLSRVLVDHDHVYYDKVSCFLSAQGAEATAAPPLDEVADHTLDLLVSLFRRLVNIYDHIDTRTITDMFHQGAL
eukprot:TRINITY_DN17745_c0_g1_i1.p1 TRINITY_DN17745_c0_g1~~TRINITY_DN17745_c0_g1_i1.p1  ORF type:complete len:906 (+),score=299.50 TRINITY_DN17745_c0_g1_i1:72-2789(+)